MVRIVFHRKQIFKHSHAVVGGPGVKPGFAASDAAVLFDYTTDPLKLAPGIQPGVVHPCKLDTRGRV